MSDSDQLDLIQDALAEPGDFIARRTRQENARIEDAKVEFLRRWNVWRLEKRGLKGLDLQHECSVKCLQEITIVHPGLSLYGCNFSGQYHVCNTQLGPCTVVAYSRSGERCCLYSGRDMGVDVYDYRRRSMYSCVDHEQDVDSKEMDYHDEESVVETAVEEDSDGPSLSMLTQEGIVPKERRQRKLMKDRVFVAKSFTDDRDTLTEIVKKLCGLYVHDLLFDKKTKIRVDNDLVRSARGRALVVTKRYMEDRTRSGMMPVFQTMCDLYTNALSSTKRVPPAEMNWQNLRKYCELANLVWNVVKQTHKGKYQSMNSMVKACVLGLLYTMRDPTGFSRHLSNGDYVQIFPCDPYLKTHLPLLRDLKYYGTVSTGILELDVATDMSGISRVQRKRKMTTMLSDDGGVSSYRRVYSVSDVTFGRDVVKTALNSDNLENAKIHLQLQRIVKGGNAPELYVLSGKKTKRKAIQSVDRVVELYGHRRSSESRRPSPRSKQRRREQSTGEIQKKKGQNVANLLYRF